LSLDPSRTSADNRRVASERSDSGGSVLVTGGAGFIGANLCDRLLAAGHRVTILDNLSRVGCRRNLEWLQERHGERSFSLVVAEVSDWDAVRRVVEGAARIYHLAGQVAVTSSIADPRRDFADNALGTLLLLEAAREVGDDPVFLFASTNKVYGALEGVGITEEATRYLFTDLPYGVPETTGLDFHSPYGCSKGAADQYVRDYARIFRLRTVVFRQSCIYGPRQFGTEDQGWVAWLLRCALADREITIFGDGKQARDLLFVDDLLDAYEAAVEHVDVAAGQVYNLGGGPANTLSVWAELGPILEELVGRPLPVRHAPARPGDQRVYVSDVRKAQRELGWRPKTGVRAGLAQLHRFLVENRGAVTAGVRV
jgi:CDP-paratose 2-epimerase